MDIIGWLIGFVGIGLSIFFYLRSRRRKSLSYKVFNNTIFSNDVQIPDLTVSYKGKKLSSFANTKIIIANTGQEVISQDHLSSVDPLKISIPEKYEVLDYSVFYADKAEVIELKRVSANQIVLNFEFLNAKEGFVVNLLHDGAPSDEVKLMGRIKGIVKIGNIKRDLSYAYIIYLIWFAFIIYVTTLTDRLFPEYSSLFGIFLVLLFFGVLYFLASLKDKGKFSRQPFIDNLLRKIEE